MNARHRLGQYLIVILLVLCQSITASAATIVIDGELNDWAQLERLDNEPDKSLTGYEVYGKLENDIYYMGIKSAVPIVDISRIFIDTDNNVSSGFQLWGWATGAEYNITIKSDLTPRLYALGDKSTPLPSNPLSFAYNNTQQQLEIALPASALDGAPDLINIYVEIIESNYLPPDYYLYHYTLGTPPTIATPEPTVIGSMTLDGQLNDWNSENLIGNGDGINLYAKYSDDHYFIAIESPVEIGPYTYIYMNTDQNQASGHLLWGWATGAEYNIHIRDNGDTQPYLYAGGDESTPLGNGPVNHYFSGDKHILEMALSSAEIQNPQAIDFWFLISDFSYLPADWYLDKYTLNTAPPSSDPGNNPGSPVRIGDVTIDGNLSEWGNTTLLGESNGARVYGKYENDRFIIALESPTGIGPYTTLYLNTDQNTSTGYLLWGFATGSEYQISIEDNGDSNPYLFTGGDFTTPLGDGAVTHAYNSDKTSLEIVLKASDIQSPDSIDAWVQINDSYYLPDDWYAQKYTFNRTQTPSKVGIVYSQTSANKFYDLKSYSYLFMSMQHQVMMAGAPFDLLKEEDLTDINLIKQYDVLVLPNITHLPAAMADDVITTLQTAIDVYDLGLITSGSFLAYDETNAPLKDNNSEGRLLSFFGLQTTHWGGPIEIDIIVTNNNHTMTSDYLLDEYILSYENEWFQSVSSDGSTQATELAILDTPNDSYTAVWAIENAASRHVHFASPLVMGNTNLVQRAIKWIQHGDNSAQVSLKLGRNNALFSSRTDLDQSMYNEVIPTIIVPFKDQMALWKTNYNFVGSLFINLGNNEANGQYTDWTISGPIYHEFMNMGNEIANHSYTHPHNTKALSIEKLNFEFITSTDIINQNLDIQVAGVAIPGLGENMTIANYMNQKFNYMSGGNSQKDTHDFQGAYGFYTPDFETINFSPVLSSDFSLIEFLGYTSEEATDIWLNEYNLMSNHANNPIIVWPWHDYAVVNAYDNGYSQDMFETVIQYAFNNGVEFVTMDDLQNRIRTQKEASLSTYQNGDMVNITVANGASFGKNALEVNSPNQVIKNVHNWYAYDTTQVLLPITGGTYKVALDTTPDNVTHITKLPMRAELINTTGNGTTLSFQFIGQGVVEIHLADATLQTTCGNSQILTGQILKIHFEQNTNHSCDITN